MPILEFYCDQCGTQFEQITQGPDDPDYGKCLKCNSKSNSRKLISGFSVAGQGDQRESTVHGCHGSCGHQHGKKTGLSN